MFHTKFLIEKIFRKIFIESQSIDKNCDLSIIKKVGIKFKEYTSQILFIKGAVTINN